MIGRISLDKVQPWYEKVIVLEMTAATKESESFFTRFSLKNFTRRKPIEKSLSEETTDRTLTLVDLTMYGIAATVGSGIYSIVGKLARGRTLSSEVITAGQILPYIDSLGPGVIFSIAIAGGLSLLTSICYLEFASALPISGSGYAYFYSMIGEFLGWFIGWNLTLEYAFAAAAVAGKWSLGLRSLLMSFYPKDEFPKVLNYLFDTPIYKEYQFRLNIVAPALILLLGLIVNRGVSMGSRFTNAATILNLSLIAFIIVIGWFYVDYSNWTEFIPVIKNASGSPAVGAMPPFTRILKGASEMFFCFIGYDTVSTLSVDAINPARDIPIAAFLTIGTATALYALIGLVLTGMSSNLPRTDTVLADAFTKSRFASYTVKIVSLMNMAVTVFASILGQPKIFAAISRDGLLPKGLARENSRGVPTRSVLATLILTAGITAIYDVEEGLIDMIAAGCLFSMSLVCAGMLACRFNNASGKTRKYGHWATIVFFVNSIFFCWSFNHEQHWIIKAFASILTVIPSIVLVYMFITRGNELKPLSDSSDVKSFVCPLMPIIPCLAILANNYVLVSISWAQISLFIAWAVIGISVYLGYGLHNSKLGQEFEAVKSFGKF